MLKKYKSYLMVSAAFFLIFVVLAVISFQYYKMLQNTVENESYGYIQEIAKQVTVNINRNINDNFAVLYSISRFLKSTGVKTYKELQPEVLAQQSLWNYKEILLIDSEGNAYDAYGQIVLLGNESYLNEAIVNRKRSMSPTGMIKGSECMVFAIPLNDIYISGVKMSALAATYDLASFDNILSLNSFSSMGYAYIIQKNGSVVVRSSSPYAPQTGYNILSSLVSDNAEDVNLTSVKTDISNGNSGVVRCYHNGVLMYTVYIPIEKSDWYLLGFVPVEVVNAKSELLMKITLLLCAVIALLFSALIAYLMISHSRHKQRLEQIAYVDPITNGHTMGRFYELAAVLLDRKSRPDYFLIYVNVEKFKLLNEEFGRRACDNLLICLHDSIDSDLTEQDCIGRLFADNFCVLLTFSSEEKLFKRFEKWYETAIRLQEKLDSISMFPIVEFGVYIIGNDSLPFTHMIDRAKLALRETSSETRGKVRYAVYDDAIRRHLFREKHLENMMENSLKNQEFRVYLQPKYLVDSEVIGGAEALVRWESQDGIIYPDEFIKLFERNGFIVQLDLWVFDEVCRMIRAWLDSGFTPVKVSVNCSRVQLKNPRFLERYTEICYRHKVDPKHLEIELTENLVFEDVAQLSKIIDSIHSAGFGCSMDDFGSGYSSLNLIKDIPVDTIKLDKIFFRYGSKDLERTESVVQSIINMSKALKMSTVAEGVEERCQVDMLKRLGCDYIQGFYFAKPMPVNEFEQLSFGRNVSGV